MHKRSYKVITAREPDPDADEFKCSSCGGIFDIEDSIKVGGKKGDLVCSYCAEKAKPRKGSYKALAFQGKTFTSPDAYGDKRLRVTTPGPNPLTINNSDESCENPQWVITVQYFWAREDADMGPTSEFNRVGTHSAWYTGSGSELPLRFRTLDDDGNVNFEGKSNCETFSPLWDLTHPDVGDVIIQYYKNGTWETL